MSRPHIADAAHVYRAIRRSWAPGGQLTFVAFLLRPTDNGGLSVSECRVNAEAALQTHRGTAQLNAGRVRAAQIQAGPLGLQLTPCDHPTDPFYAQIMGLPPYPEEGTEARELANEAADALLMIARYPEAEHL